MTQRKNKRVTLRGSRRSAALGQNDPRHRREAQERMNPRADVEKEALEARVKALEDKAK